jgi:ribosomal protein S18 acetylase RimI-like enzyme
MGGDDYGATLAAGRDRMVTTTVAVRLCEERDLAWFGRFGGERHVEFCRESIERPDVVILVAVDDDDLPIGKLHVDLGAMADERVAAIVAASVTPELRNHGIGTTLIRKAEGLARTRGFRVVEIGVEESNPDARRLYERLGYQVVSQTEFRYKGAPVPNPGVLMRRDLGTAW